MNITWKQTALQSLIQLDLWREDKGWSDIGEYLVEIIETYFNQQDMSVYIPGRIVSVKGMPINMRMVLISPGKSAPYKVFYRYDKNEVEIFLIRHPHQKPLYQQRERS